MFIICDIDGTIVDKKGRPLNNVLYVVRLLLEYREETKLIISTARPQERHQETAALLAKLNLPYSQLLMNMMGGTDDAAKEGNARRNALTPDNTIAVFENNKACIKMYRRLGFTVFGCKKPEKEGL